MSSGWPTLPWIEMFVCESGPLVWSWVAPPCWAAKKPLLPLIVKYWQVPAGAGEVSRADRAGSGVRERVLVRVERRERPDDVSLTVPGVAREVGRRPEVVEEILDGLRRIRVRRLLRDRPRQHDHRAVQSHDAVHRRVHGIEVHVRAGFRRGESDLDRHARVRDGLAQRAGHADDLEAVRAAARELVGDEQRDGLAFRDEQDGTGDARAQRRAARRRQRGAVRPRRDDDAVHHLVIGFDHRQVDGTRGLTRGPDHPPTLPAAMAAMPLPVNFRNSRRFILVPCSGATTRDSRRAPRRANSVQNSTKPSNT